MAQISASKVVPFLWFEKEAEEAARFYVSLLPNSRVERIDSMPADSPSGPAGSVQIVEFTLAGTQFMAMNAGPLDPFNHAVSFMIHCDTQEEIDRLWAAFSEGGHVEQCGWVRDRWGVAWQIVPAMLQELMRHPDRARGKRAAEAMLKMVKLDIGALKRAFEG